MRREQTGHWPQPLRACSLRAASSWISGGAWWGRPGNPRVRQVRGWNWYAPKKPLPLLVVYRPPDSHWRSRTHTSPSTEPAATPRRGRRAERDTRTLARLTRRTAGDERRAAPRDCWAAGPRELVMAPAGSAERSLASSVVASRRAATRRKLR